MRLVLVLVLAGLVALPQSASAQADEEGAEPAPEQPALQLELDEAGVQVAAGYAPRTPDGYTLEELELRVKKARRGLIGTSVILGVGVALWSSASACSDPPSTEEFVIVDLPPCFGLIVTGFVLTGVGFIGMLVSGPVLGARKRKLRRLQEAHYGKPRRVQWDLAQSRLVF
jgi:hypothetical protein